jgi:hypothetical protein
LCVWYGIGTFAAVTGTPPTGQRGACEFLTLVDGTIWVLDRALEPEWSVLYRVVEQDGNPVVAELRVVPAPHSEEEDEWAEEALLKPQKTWGVEPPVADGGLLARQVRAVRPGRAIKESRRWAALERENPIAHALGFRFSDSVLNAPRHVGRRGRSDRFYVEVCVAYIDAVQAGEPAPVQAAADRLGFKHAHVRDALHRARRRGLLTPPPPGRAGGQLTDKARAVLAEPEEQ